MDCEHALHSENDVAKALIGIVLIVIGGAWLLAEKPGLGRLLGEIAIEPNGMRC